MGQQTPEQSPKPPINARTVRIRLGKNRVTETNITVLMLWSVTVFFVAFGLIMVLSSSSITSYLSGDGFLGSFSRQAMYAAIGLTLMFVVSRFPVAFWKKGAWWFFGASILLQLLVFTPLGFEVGGNRNWLRITSTIGMQPAEFLKLAMIVWMGAVLHTKEKLLSKPVHVIIPAMIPGALIAIATVLLGSDLGTALVMFGIVLGVFFFADIQLRVVLGTLGAAALIAVLFVITSGNRMRRVLGLFTSAEDYSGHDWQPLHGIWALAGGGVFGSGLGASKAKWSWLPAADNDYIFAIVGEEFGMFGAVAVIILYIVLAVLLLNIIGLARDRFGKALVGGVLVWVVGQAMINIGVVLRLLPVIGLPLPLLSAGGTALIATLLAIGVVLSVARDGVRYQQELRAENLA